MARRKVNNSDEGGHGGGRKRLGGHAGGFQGRLQREAVDHGGQHAHVVAMGAAEAAVLALQAAEDVAAADDDADLDAHLADGLDLCGHLGQDGIGEAFAGLRIAQDFAAEFQEDSAVLWLFSWGALSRSQVMAGNGTGGRIAFRRAQRIGRRPRDRRGSIQDSRGRVRKGILGNPPCSAAYCLQAMAMASRFMAHCGGTLLLLVLEEGGHRNGGKQQEDGQHDRDFDNGQAVFPVHAPRLLSGCAEGLGGGTRGLGC